MQDPTRDEMLSVLSGLYAGETDAFDIEEAMYWFSHDYHWGQFSNLYSALSTSQFNPGRLACGPDPESMASLLYDELVAEYA